MIFNITPQHVSNTLCLYQIIYLSGAEFVKEHVDYGEVFGEWRLFESARACYNFFHKRQLLEGPHGLVTVMGDCCDFLHPRINNSTVLQNIQHVTSVIPTTLYDGQTEEDLDLLMIEMSRLCVPRLCLSLPTCLLYSKPTHAPPHEFKIIKTSSQVLRR